MAVQKTSLDLFDDRPGAAARPVKGQLLKWVGNKQRFALELVSYFPRTSGTYFEPFLGSGAVLGVLAPERAVAGDAFAPLIEIWCALRSDYRQVVEWYADRRSLIDSLGKEGAYRVVRESYNSAPNGPDFLYLSRACYGGVIRFRKVDGFMSTPCGAHTPIPVDSFAARARDWASRVAGTEFYNCDYRQLMRLAKPGDMVYCDPPYVDSQSILYGAQEFRIEDLLDEIEACKERGVFVALSIDGSKKSGKSKVAIPERPSLFAKELTVRCGRSMLRRFQMDGKTLEHEDVTDRLLLTY